MPHLVILYTPNLESETDLTALCRALADAMLTVKDGSNGCAPDVATLVDEVSVVAVVPSL